MQKKKTEKITEFFEQKTYNLNQFGEDEKKLAKGFIKEAILGFIELTIDEKADEFFNKIAKFNFAADDTMTMTFEITTVGNDILAAIGAGKRQIKKVKK